MSARRIIFTFKDKYYEIPLEAEGTERVVLPDGTLLKISGWNESIPQQPNPACISEMEHRMDKSDVIAIAAEAKAAITTETTKPEDED